MVTPFLVMVLFYTWPLLIKVACLAQSNDIQNDIIHGAINDQE